MPPEKLHWKHLFEEVVTSGLCTGCAGCVVACPHDVLGYQPVRVPLLGQLFRTYGSSCPRFGYLG
jgi:ferredoxin